MKRFWQRQFLPNPGFTVEVEHKRLIRATSDPDRGRRDSGNLLVLIVCALLRDRNRAPGVAIVVVDVAADEPAIARTEHLERVDPPFHDGLYPRPLASGIVQRDHRGVAKV